MTTHPREGFDELTMAEHPFLAGFEFHEQLESTNDFGLQLASEPSLPSPYLIQAAIQSKGRGRGDHRWWATSGSLTCSLVVDSEQLGLSPEQWPVLSLVTGLAIAEAFGDYVAPSRMRVKWPNDIFVDELKLGGILIESARGDKRRFVIGFGLNVNNALQNSLPNSPQALDRSLTDFDFSEATYHDLVRQATSLVDELGHEVPLKHALWSVLSSLARHYGELARDGYPLLERWQTVCFLTGKNIRVRSGERLLEGVCQGINSRGALKVATPTGLETCFAGEVEWKPRHY